MLLFVSGTSTQDAVGILEAARAVMGNVPTLLAVTTGARTDRAEYEGVPGLAGLVWRGGRSEAFCPPIAVEAGRASPRPVEPQSGRRAGSATLLLATSEPEALAASASLKRAGLSPEGCTLGAGTAKGGAFCLTAEGQIERRGAVALALSGLAAPVIRVASPCRPLTPLLPITASEGSLILRLDGRPALEVLSAGARSAPGHPLVLAMTGRAEAADAEDQELTVRGIRGVDPSRGAVLVNEEPPPGTRFGFGALDPAAARLEYGRALRHAARKLNGAAPLFALLLGCGGRGTSFYGSTAVESALLRERFPRAPFAGTFSPFEIAPFGSECAVSVYTAVVAVFGIPS